MSQASIFAYVPPMKNLTVIILFLILLTSSCQPTRSTRVEPSVDRRETLDVEHRVIPGFDSYSEVIPGTEVSIEMKPIPGGTFLMGRSADEDGKAPHEGPQREVLVDDFWMAKHEITWDQYDFFVKESLEQLEAELNPDTLLKFGIPADAFTIPSPPYEDETHGMGTGRSGYPAISITHFAAIEYAKWLTAKTGNFYRLPTEAEWEYACRAGNETVYAHGNNPDQLDDFEWYRGNSGRSYHRAGLKKPNTFGLHDMQGNVSEWTMDQYLEDYHEQLEGEVADNPWFTPDDLYPRAVRGGSWRDDADDIRCTTRQGSTGQWSRGDPQIPRSMWWHTNAPFVGFRIVRPLETPEPEEIKKYWIDPVLDF